MKLCFFIDTLKEEMTITVQHIYEVEEGEKIVVNSFQRVKRIPVDWALFEMMHNSLSKSWEKCFTEVKKYVAEHSNLKEYKTQGEFILYGMTEKETSNENRQHRTGLNC